VVKLVSEDSGWEKDIQRIVDRDVRRGGLHLKGETLCRLMDGK